MSSVLTFTSFDAIQDSVSHVRAIYSTGKTRSLEFRKNQIQNLYNLVSENEESFYEALDKDMKKPKCEAMNGDIAPTLDECLYFINNLNDLAKDVKVKPRSIVNGMEKVIIRKDPLGVVLIIGCWNYPVQLSLIPLMGAIAAGNCAIVKLSEVAPYTAALITRLFPKYMDTSCYRIVNGSTEETTALLNEKFNHIFYTGNGTVGRIVMAAAVKNLTPVTLELGGKSPALITSDADIQLTANRIAFGKFFNCGQICVAVDYVLVPKELLNVFTESLKKALEWYGPDPQKSKDYARIVSDRHVKRIADQLNNRTSGDIVIGGEVDPSDRYIAPTVVANVKADDESLMGEEIFGPILPIITYNNLDEAIALINKRDPPLAFYIFTQKQTTAEKIMKNTQSGGVCVNDCLMHQAEYSIPFGGVGSSGMGNYHGAKSFTTFTHERSMLIKKQNMEKVAAVRYPPYSERKYNIVRFIMIKHPSLLWLKAHWNPIRFLAIGVAVLAFYFKKKVIV